MGIERRSFLRRLGIGLGTALTIPFENAANTIKKRIENSSAILDIEPMGFQWETLDPFLFCVHHEEAWVMTL
jgi:hypothetical protein